MHLKVRGKFRCGQTGMAGDLVMLKVRNKGAGPWKVRGSFGAVSVCLVLFGAMPWRRGRENRHNRHKRYRQTRQDTLRTRQVRQCRCRQRLLSHERETVCPSDNVSLGTDGKFGAHVFVIGDVSRPCMLERAQGRQALVEDRH